MKKILAIESKTLYQEKIKTLIPELGYEITGIFVNGEEAVEYCLINNLPDLVIIDIDYFEGNLNGYEIAEKIISKTTIPIIFLTETEKEIDFISDDEVGVYIYLSKPFTKQELQNNIELAFHKYNIWNKLHNNLKEKELLLENIDIQIWYMRKPEIYGAVNKAHADFFDLDKGEVEYRNIYDVLGEKNAKKRVKDNKKVFSTKEQIKIKEWLLNKKGEERFLSITKTPYLDKCGKVKYVVCSAEDITYKHKLENTLRNNRNYLKTIINTIPDIIILLDKNGDYLDLWSSKPHNLVAPKNELVGQNINDILPDKIANKFKKYCLQAIQEDELQTYEYSLDFDEGKKYFEAHFVAIDAVVDSKKEVLATIRNITERKEAEIKLNEAKKQLETIYENVQNRISLVNIDDNNRFKYVKTNNTYQKAVEKKEEQIKGKTPLELFGKEMGKKIRANYLECYKKKKTISYEEKLDLPGGEKTWLTKLSPIIVDNKVAQIVGTSVDITDRIEAEDRIKYLSFHDEMTGLYNRRYFENEIERLSQSRKLPISIIIGDLDGLKYINDNYGHKVGDECIKKAGEVFASSIRKEDIAARIGGDEFAIILPEADSDSALGLCNRIQNKCKKTNETHKMIKPLKISLGHATMTKKEGDLDEIFDKADKNMYKIKGCRRKKLN